MVLMELFATLLSFGVEITGMSRFMPLFQVRVTMLCSTMGGLSFLSPSSHSRFPIGIKFLGLVI